MQRVTQACAGAQGDLFMALEAQPWVPAVGDLVLIRPDSHWGRFSTAADLAMPHRVARDSGEIVPGHHQVWVTPIGPTRTRTRADGRVVIERPTHQTVCGVDDLMPFTGELPLEPETKRGRAA